MLLFYRTLSVNFWRYGNNFQPSDYYAFGLLFSALRSCLYLTSSSFTCNIKPWKKCFLPKIKVNGKQASKILLNLILKRHETLFHINNL